MKLFLGVLWMMRILGLGQSWSMAFFTSRPGINIAAKIKSCRISTISSILSLGCCFLSFPLLANAAVPIDQLTGTLTSSPIFTQEQIIQSLTPPTDEKPQIRPPDLSQLSTQRPDTQNTPIMEGMVYLLDSSDNSDDRPDINDIIVITMANISDPENILAGAKYPVYKARLPFNFQLKAANVIKGKEDLYHMAMDKDLWVDVRVCPEDSVHLPCLKEESTFLAQGVSKLVKIPGTKKEDEQVIVRTAAALPLMRNENHKMNTSSQ